MFLSKMFIAKLIKTPFLKLFLKRDLARATKSCKVLFDAAAPIKLHILTYLL